MSQPHPSLPNDRPLTSAHRAGNDLALANAVIAMGVDLIETDVWLHKGQLEVRHRDTMGPIPLLREGWSLRPGWKPRILLRELLEATPEDAILFLDLKGDEIDLSQEIMTQLRSIQPGRRIAMCGRNWPQLDPVVSNPDVTVFYSVGDEKERATVLPRLQKMDAPALSIHRKLITPDFIEQVKKLDTVVISWDVNTLEQSRRLHDLGVDGFTSDNLPMLAKIARERGAAFA